MLCLAPARARYVPGYWIGHAAARSYEVGENEARMAANRIKRLKDLVDRLERLPASPDRDRVLMEARSRAVDLDTGETPRALPIREAVPAPVAHRPPARPRPEGATRRVPRAPAPAPVEPAPPGLTLAPGASAAGSQQRQQPLPTDGLLWLDDAQLPLDDSLHLPTERRVGRRAVPPWTLGLRG
jgi:hypothetical protein